MKTCKKCGLELHISEFYAHPKMRDGRLSFCKACVKSRVHDHRAKNIDRIQAYDRERGQIAAATLRRRAYALSGRGDESIAKSRKQWVSKNPEKRLAHIAVRNALKCGRLTKGKCEICDSSNTHGHHEDYSRPLVVRWLCHDHHMEHHRVERETGRHDGIDRPAT